MTHRSPHAAVLAVVAFLLLWTGMAFGQSSEPVSGAEPFPVAAAPTSVEDPYENWNRKVFGFNEFIDRWFLKPVARSYRAVMPGFADKAVTNFFNNLSELRNFTKTNLLAAWVSSMRWNTNRRQSRSPRVIRSFLLQGGYWNTTTPAA